MRFIELILALVITSCILTVLLLIFYFKDHTKFESELDNIQQQHGLKGVINRQVSSIIEKFLWIIGKSDSFKIKILEEDKIAFIRNKVLIALLFGAIGLVLKSPLILVIGMAFGWFFPSLVLTSQYNSWKLAVVSGLPTLVKYVSLYLGMGFNMRNALTQASQYVNNELRELLTDCLARIGNDGRYKKHLSDIQGMIRGKYEGHSDAVIKRIIIGWQNPDPSSYDDIGTFLRELEEADIERLTGQKKTQYMILLPMTILGLFTMVGVTLLNWVIHAMFI